MEKTSKPKSETKKIEGMDNIPKTFIRLFASETWKTACQSQVMINKEVYRGRTHARERTESTAAR